MIIIYLTVIHYTYIYKMWIAWFSLRLRRNGIASDLTHSAIRKFKSRLNSNWNTRHAPKHCKRNCGVCLN